MSPRGNASVKRGKADDDDDFSSASPTRKRPKVKLPKDTFAAEEKPKANRKRAPQNRVCEYCGATETPIWRRGPHGKGTLCNRCGVKWMTGKIVLDEEGNLKYIGGAPQYAQRKQMRVMNRSGSSKKKSEGSSADDLTRSKQIPSTKPNQPIRPIPPIRAGLPSTYLNEAAELLSYERKKLLSDAIGHLSDDHIDEVVEIIKMRMPDLPTSQQPNDDEEEEIELDMDTIDQGTLQLLYTYVEKIGIIKDGRLEPSLLLGPENPLSGSYTPGFETNGLNTVGSQMGGIHVQSNTNPATHGAARAALGAAHLSGPRMGVFEGNGGLAGIDGRGSSEDRDTSEGSLRESGSLKDDDMSVGGDEEVEGEDRDDGDEEEGADL
ncbi:hypothetical protein M427DRAFT_50638 [Gonapodya prolifera JEL478]|uniref:GATA-type domain-containing protein n=1 Tax=Gonapodya prolifera (strain JEL478) TaxID=1344416 RepID=A0A139AZZ1_GONPJ|nr:hypothetical protein M427DRAFT_50638 [Gonapodya prolifera JEL478]|eukprot:KXS22312.1 hypothetical protein M427DRAFT_50638 [Gonapodya prolifera JEL478]